MDKVPVEWESFIKKCPHCGDQVNIHHISTISQKHLLGMIYQSLHRHYIEDCLFNDFPKCIKIDMEIKNKLKNSHYVKLHETEKIKLIV